MQNKKKLFILPEWFKSPPIPKSLQAKFEAEQVALANEQTDFMLKYVGWVLLVMFILVDRLFTPNTFYLSTLIRLFVFPASFFMYSAKKIKIFKTFPRLRFGLVIVYGVITVHILTIVNTTHTSLYTYAQGNHLISIVLILFLQPSLRTAILILTSVYIPYLIYAAIIQPESGPMAVVLISGLGISLALICNCYLRDRTVVAEFLNREKIRNDADIGENISQISHDTRSPLLALRALQQGYFKAEQANEILKTSVGRLIELVEEITQSASSLHINIQNVNLSSFFQECREYAQFLHPTLNIIWKFEIKEESYSFDKNKIKRVIINLINNAEKASKTSTAPEIIIKASNENGLNIEVWDNGSGFSSDKELFKKGISKFGSTGLGLHFCKQVIVEHGGTIEAARLDEKTVFRIKL